MTESIRSKLLAYAIVGLTVVTVVLALVQFWRIATGRDRPQRASQMDLDALKRRVDAIEQRR